jgi:sensor histidine kinase regulating citrate/malate metabolism
LAINYVYDKYVLEVSNNGEKISEVEIDKIFEPGYTTKGSVGRGYGLFLTKNLIEKYGGTIEVYCQENTVFQIMFLCKEGEVSE